MKKFLIELGLGVGVVAMIALPIWYLGPVFLAEATLAVLVLTLCYAVGFTLMHWRE